MQNINLESLSAKERQALVQQAKEIVKKEKQAQENNRKAFKEMSVAFVNNHIDWWVHHKEITLQAIESLYKEFNPLLSLKAEAYGVHINEQDSHTFTLEDGSASITLGYNVTIGFDGTENAGVQKIKNFIGSLASDDENVTKLSKMVNTFLKPNAKTGMLNPAKIIELSKLRDEFNNAEFNDGIEIIFNAQQRRQNSMYVAGFKFVQTEQGPKKIEYRFTV